MNKSIIYLLLLLIFVSCQKKAELIKMTVVYHNNRNIDLKWEEKKLIKDSFIDLEKAKIDIYFCKKIAKIPYYLPTNGIYKDSIKDNECDMSIYPANVKCYKYDNKSRVISMSVEGSGTMGSWNYKYDTFDRIIEIERLGSIYTIKYHDKYDLLKEITKDLPGNPEERIEILYE